MKFARKRASFLLFVAAIGAAHFVEAQSAYQAIAVPNGGTIKGTVKWQGALPHLFTSEINKDPQICDPLSQKHRDLERLVVSSDGGVANTVVYLKDVSAGKPLDLPAPRRYLNQKNCRYEPHILLVPAAGALTVKSSDPILHTVHMSGSAEYNLPFVTAGQEITRSMTREGTVDLRCNAGHVWMNAEMIVAANPYYAVTDADGNFELTDVPPGQYQIVAWHEGWRVVGESPLYDVMTQVRVKRPVFSAPVVWSKSVTVPARDTVKVDFTLGEKTPQLAQGH
ncbi:MAG TPA: carboxypeptidase-like regulatory domain-containing protein [Terriglobales bacterium]|nr:carboxypeptidase-like regulatory domain-containing protein [Terriglobales bacterium]